MVAPGRPQFDQHERPAAEALAGYVSRSVLAAFDVFRPCRAPAPCVTKSTAERTGLVELSELTDLPIAKNFDTDDDRKAEI